MSKKEIAILSFKVLSIYAFIHALDRLSDIFYFMSGHSAFDEISLINLAPRAITTLLVTICGVLLWYGAPLFASSIFDSSGPYDGGKTSLDDIQVVAFSIIGLFIMATSFSDFAYLVSFSIESFGERGRSWISPRNGHIAAFIVKMALGFWLLLGSRGLVNFIRSTRRE